MAQYTIIDSTNTFILEAIASFNLNTMKYLTFNR